MEAKATSNREQLARLLSDIYNGTVAESADACSQFMQNSDTLVVIASVFDGRHKTLVCAGEASTHFVVLHIADNTVKLRTINIIEECKDAYPMQST